MVNTRSNLCSNEANNANSPLDQLIAMQTQLIQTMLQNTQAHATKPKFSPIAATTTTSIRTHVDDSKLQSNFVFCLDGGAVSLKSSKQDTVADSTMEDEYIASSEDAEKAVWIRNFVFQLSVAPSASSPMDLYCDNSVAIAQAKEPRAHKKAKHVLRRYHVILEIVSQGDVKVCKMHTDHNVVDPLMKPLPQPKHEACMRSMGNIYLHD
jgi:hypothetical protein